MKPEKNNTPHFHLIYSFFLLLFFTMGTFIIVHQSDKPQNLNSHAAGNTICTVTAAQLVIKPQEQVLFGEINQYRTQKKINRLVWDTDLKKAAAWLDTDMVKSNILNHVDSLGRTPDVRLANCGYTITNGYGETLAEGVSDAKTVFTIWKNDPENNKMMLDPKYTIAGIAMEITPSGNSFWTMDLGTSTY